MTTYINPLNLDKVVAELDFGPVVAAFGPIGSGKSGWLMGQILDAPGAVINTSTKTEVYHKTAPLIRGQDRPVYIFNPTNFGELASTISFDPLVGCEDPNIAYRRAVDLMAGTPLGGKESETWKGQACRVLAGLLHAAALGELTMSDVSKWASDPEHAEKRVCNLLAADSPSATEFEADLKDFFGNPKQNPTSSIIMSIRPCLQWLVNPTARASAKRTNSIDVDELLAKRGVVYLIGESDGQVAPLVTALTGYIAHEVKRIAALQSSGRIDPAFTLVLDEAANICRVPLNKWTSEMRGHGVRIVIAFQTLSQLEEGWGRLGAQTILGNIVTSIVFGALDIHDAKYWSDKAGFRENNSIDLYRTGGYVNRAPRLELAQLGMLEKFEVIIFTVGMQPLGPVRMKMFWERQDVQALDALVHQAGEALVTETTQYVAQVAGHQLTSSPTQLVHQLAQASPGTNSPTPGTQLELTNQSSPAHQLTQSPAHQDDTTTPKPLASYVGGVLVQGQPIDRWRWVTRFARRRGI